MLCPALGPYPAAAEVDHTADTRIELEWDEELFALVGPPNEEPPPGHRPRRLPGNVTFRWHGDEGLHDRTCDARGNRLTFLTAGELDALRPAAKATASWWNQAVFAFIAALPAETPVVLFWD